MDINQYKDLNIGNVFTLRYTETSDDVYSQSMTKDEFNTMQGWLDKSMESYRSDVLEEVAAEFDKMKVLGDTAQSFAAFVRGMKT